MFRFGDGVVVFSDLYQLFYICISLYSYHITFITLHQTTQLRTTQQTIRTMANKKRMASYTVAKQATLIYDSSKRLLIIFEGGEFEKKKFKYSG